jgi:hypothetical protein
MATKNKQLLAVLKQLNKKIQEDSSLKDSARLALDQMLSLDSNKAADLTAAFEKHSAFWNTIGIEKAAEDADGFLLDEDDGVTSVHIIQEAVASRVNIGLQGAVESVVLGVLKNNSEECREYLAVVLASSPLKKETLGERKMLTEDSLRAIQQDIAHDKLCRLVSERLDSASPEQLKALVEAQNDESLRQAALTLGFPNDTGQTLFLTFEKWNKENDLKEAVLASYAKKKIELYAASLSDGDFATLGNELIQDDQQLEKYINTTILVLPEGTVPPVKELTRAKEVLGARVLQAELSLTKNLTVDEFNSVKTVSAMSGLLKKSKISEKLINSAVTESTLPSLQAALLTNLISTMKVDKSAGLEQITHAANKEGLENALKSMGVNVGDWIQINQLEGIRQAAIEKLNNFRKDYSATTSEQIGEIDDKNQLLLLAQTGDLTRFREKLKQALPRTNGTEWINDKEMVIFKQNACARALLLKMGSLDTTLGQADKPHSTLLGELTKRPIEEQIALLEDKTKVRVNGISIEVDNNALRHLMTTTEPTTVSYYLPGCDGSVPSSVVEENNRSLLYGQIHNPALASAMAKKQILIDQDRVDLINQKLAKWFPENDQVNVVDDFLKNELQFEDDVAKSIQELTEIQNCISHQDTTRLLNLTINTLKPNTNTNAEASFLNVLKSLKSCPNIGTKDKLKTVLKAMDSALLDHSNQNAKTFASQFAQELKNKSVTLDEDLVTELTNHLSEEQFTELLDSRRNEILQANLTQTKWDFDYSGIELTKGKWSVSNKEQNARAKRKEEIESRNQAFTSINTEIEQMKALKEPLVKVLNQFTKNSSVLPKALGSKDESFNTTEHSSSPAFDALIQANSTNMAKQFKALQEDQRFTLEVLLRNQNRLDAIKKSLSNITLSTDDKDGGWIKKRAKDEVTQELEVLKGEIDVCKKALKKINLIVVDIDRVQAGAKVFSHQESNKNVSYLTDGELLKTRESLMGRLSASDPIDALSMSNTQSSKAILVDMGGVDKKHTLTEIKSQTEGTVGVYVKSFNASEQTRKITADGSLTRSSGVTIEMLKAPFSKRGKEDTRPEAIIPMYMAMARDMIEAHGGLPTKDNPITLRGGTPKQMEYLWTALMISGESQRMDPKAIRIETGGFKPSAVSKPVMLLPYSNIQKYTKESAYKEIFMNNKELLDRERTKTDTVILDAKAVLKTAKLETGYVTAAYKGQVAEAKTVLEEKKEAIARQVVQNPMTSLDGNDSSLSELRPLDSLRRS